MNLRSFALGLAGLAASAILIYFAKPIAILLLSGFGIETEESKPQVAEVIATNGRSFFRPSGHGAFSKLKPETQLSQRDEIKTEKASRIHLRFDSGYEIEVLEESQAILDVWSNRTKRQPKYISFLRGDYRVLQKGKAGELYIVLEDEVFQPESRPEATQKNFKISTDTSKASPSSIVKKEPETLPDTVDTVAKNKKTTVSQQTKKSDTLSSAYIESVFMGRSALFRRCQLTSLRDNKMARGKMLFSFVIQPKGRVQKVKLLQKDFENKALENCVSSVIERTKFRTYTGQPISLSYPLSFQ